MIMRGGKGWTRGELDYLQDNRSMPDDEIAETLGRTPNAVGVKRRRLGIIRERPWSGQEILRLKQDFYTRTAEAIALEMHRTPGAIRARSRILGLKKMSRRIWTGDEESQLRQRYGKEPMHAIATAMGRSRSSVQHKARTMDLSMQEEDRLKLASRPHKWTGEKIAATIRRMADENDEISLSQIRTREKSMYNAILRDFGGVDEAVSASGCKLKPSIRRVVVPPGRTAWSKEKIVDEIRRVHSRGGDLSASYCLRYRPRLYSAATRTDRYFGSWGKALAAAGIGYKDVRKHRAWGKDEVLKALLHRRDSEEDLSPRGIASIDSGLYAAISRLFGSYRAALEQIGVEYCDVIRHEQWDRDRVIEEIRGLARQGAELSDSKIQTEYTSLYDAGRRYFGTWGEATEAAGLDYGKIRLDMDTEAYRGKQLHLLMAEAFGILARDYDSPRFRYPEEDCLPDFVAPDGTWIDVKLRQWSKGVYHTVEKYLRYTDRLEIYYLKPSRSRHLPVDVEFVPITSLHKDMREAGGEDVADAIELLRRGIDPRSLRRYRRLQQE